MKHSKEKPLQNGKATVVSADNPGSQAPALSSSSRGSASSSPYPSLSPTPEPETLTAHGQPQSANRGPASHDPQAVSDDGYSADQAGFSDGLTERLFRSKSKAPVAAIFIHAGAGFHSTSNEHIHLEACSEAAKMAMNFLKSGASAVDAVEAAIKCLEDTEITNAGYGSNLTIDGIVEADATIVDHLGRSGACGAVSMVKNPISLARLILDKSNVPLSLRRIPPNILVGDGARQFAEGHGMRLVSNDRLASAGALDRYRRWCQDLQKAYEMSRHSRPITLNPTAAGPRAKDSETTTKPVLPIISASKKETRTPARHSRRERTAPTGSPNAWDEEQTKARQQMAVVGKDSASGSATRARHTASRRILPRSHASSAMQSLMPELVPSGVSAETSTAPDASDSGPQPKLQAIHSSSAASPRTAAPYTKKRRMDRRNSQSHDETRTRRKKREGSGDGTSEDHPASNYLPNSKTTRAVPGPVSMQNAIGEINSHDKDADIITDTVGAIAIDLQGNIAAGSSSGGIGMKHAGRIGPAALVGIGTAVVPVDARDSAGTSVAAVTSGTGEHMATTMASHTCAERLYYNMRRANGNSFVSEYDEDALMASFVTEDFMGHPGVRNQISGGAIGVMAVKKTNKGIYFYYSHNTDSFALASMASDEPEPLVVMSRLGNSAKVTRGGRKIKNSSS